MQEYIKKILGSGNTLIISNKDIEDLIKIVKSLEDSGLLLKGVIESAQNEVTEQKGRFLSMLLGTLGASLLGNLLAGKGINRAGEGTVTPPHPLSNFEIQKYYQNEPRFNGAYSRDNLPNKIKDGAYVKNLDEYSDIGAHWIALYVKDNDITYFDSFGVEHIPKEIKAFIKNKYIKVNIFKIQAYDSIMCRYFCVGFIKFMLKGKSLTAYTNLFSLNNF